jgi:hypothetical protein
MMEPQNPPPPPSRSWGAAGIGRQQNDLALPRHPSGRPIWGRLIVYDIAAKRAARRTVSRHTAKRRERWILPPAASGGGGGRLRRPGANTAQGRER